ncbi:MAG: hypothetical protein JNK73_13065 [Bacteroidia bacterium]|nr:hypothetical protein [Bacteroidia bacterium]
MALNPERKKRRNAKIISKFNELCDKKTPGGKRLYSYEAMIEKLSEEFDLSEFTIEQILKQQ